MKYRKAHKIGVCCVENFSVLSPWTQVFILPFCVSLGPYSYNNAFSIIPVIQHGTRWRVYTRTVNWEGPHGRRCKKHLRAPVLESSFYLQFHVKHRFYKGCSSEILIGVPERTQYIFDNNLYSTLTTHGWQYETGYRYWPPLFRHLSQRCTSFIIPSAKDTGYWMNHCSTASRTACPSESSSRAVHMIVTGGWSRTAQGVPCCVGSMWACVIVENKHTPRQFSSFYWHCCRMCLCFTSTTLI
jgi:hypothetical protein